MPDTLLKFLAAAVLLLALSSNIGHTRPSDVQSAETAPDLTSLKRNLSTDDIEAYFDGYVPLALEQGDIAGAVVVVVSGGEILLSKGYGYADVETRRPVSPASTLFRIGSVSKLFIWISVMQLVESGELDLDEDVQTYLDFDLQTRFEDPITLRHLMTHTAGFQESLRDLMPPDGAPLLPIGDYLASHIPAQINRPGSIVAYSNYGATLAAYIVERVSGEAFETYVEQEIFDPFGMVQSTFRQPAPERFEQLLASGYRSMAEGPRPFELIQVAPAGSMSATAEDMSRFMIAMLANGEGILSPATTRNMLRRHHATHPAVSGMSLGWLEDNYRGIRTIGHAGATQTQITELRLIPEADIGFFVAMNSFGQNASAVFAQRRLFRGFVDRYFRDVSQAPSAGIDSAHARLIEGRYITSRRVQEGPFSLAHLFGEATVTAGEEGSLTVSLFRDLAGNPKRFREIEPFVYRAVTGGEQLAVIMDDNERPVAIAADDLRAVAVLEPVAFHRSASLNIPLLAGVSLVFAATLILWPVAALNRRAWSGSKIENPAARLRIGAKAGALLGLVCLGGWMLWVVAGSANLGLFSSANLIWFHLLQLCGWLALVAAVIAVICMTHVWRDGQRSWWVKIGWTLLILAYLAFAWLGFTFDLLDSTGY